jgi:hypothetical protein
MPDYLQNTGQLSISFNEEIVMPGGLVKRIVIYRKELNDNLFKDFTIAI